MAEQKDPVGEVVAGRIEQAVERAKNPSPIPQGNSDSGSSSDNGDGPGTALIYCP